jgi:hypothetical protein
MDVNTLAAEIEILLSSGWLPCGTCEGKAYRLPPGSGKEPYPCADCENNGFIHPFLSWDEYQEQLAERGAT